MSKIQIIEECKGNHRFVELCSVQVTRLSHHLTFCIQRPVLSTKSKAWIKSWCLSLFYCNSDEMKKIVLTDSEQTENWLTIELGSINERIILSHFPDAQIYCNFPDFVGVKIYKPLLSLEFLFAIYYLIFYYLYWAVQRGSVLLAMQARTILSWGTSGVEVLLCLLGSPILRIFLLPSAAAGWDPNIL